MRVRELLPQDLRQLDLPQNTRGVSVAGVEADSNAADKLQPGDIIEAINQEPVVDLNDYAKKMRSLPAGDPAVVGIIRARARTLVVIPAS